MRKRNSSTWLFIFTAVIGAALLGGLPHQASAVYLSSWDVVIPADDPQYPSATGVSATLARNFQISAQGSLYSGELCYVGGPSGCLGGIAVGDTITIIDDLSNSNYYLGGNRFFPMNQPPSSLGINGWTNHSMIISNARRSFISSDPDVINCTNFGTGKESCQVKKNSGGQRVRLTVTFAPANTIFSATHPNGPVSRSHAFPLPEITYEVIVSGDEPPKGPSVTCNSDSPTADGATLSWGYSHDGGIPWDQSYVQVATDSGFSNLVWAESRCAPGGCSGLWNGTAEDSATAVGLADPNQNYFWAAAVYDLNGLSAWKECGSFRITAGPPPAEPLCQFFTSSPRTILRGQTSALSWMCENVDSCSIDQGIGAVPVSGEQRVAPQKTTVYTLTCSRGSSISTPTFVEVNVFAPTRIEVHPSTGR